MTVDIAGGAAQDGAGNPSVAAVQFSIVADLTPVPALPVIGAIALALLLLVGGARRRTASRRGRVRGDANVAPKGRRAVRRPGAGRVREGVVNRCAGGRRAVRSSEGRRHGSAFGGRSSSSLSQRRAPHRRHSCSSSPSSSPQTGQIWVVGAVMPLPPFSAEAKGVQVALACDAPERPPPPVIP